MEAKLLKKLIKAKNDVSKKYKEIKSNRMENEIFLEETFKPLIEPLQGLKGLTEEGINEQIKREVKNEFLSQNQSFDLDHNKLPIQSESNKLSIEDASKNDENLVEEPPEKYFKQSPHVNDSPSFTTPNRRKTSKIPTFTQSTPINSKTARTPTTLNTSKNPAAALAQYYTGEYFNSNGRNIDQAFGPKYIDEHDHFKIGRSKIAFTPDGIEVDKDTYLSTQGLYELIFMKSPEDYTASDLSNYKNILLKSNVYRRDVNDDSSNIKGNAGEKYKNIISGLVTRKKAGGLRLVNNQRPKYAYWNDSINTNRSFGEKHKNIISGLITRKRASGVMEVNDQSPNYAYWNDPNELVERLKFLMELQAAAHVNHRNEIDLIIEELREADIIA